MNIRSILTSDGEPVTFKNFLFWFLGIVCCDLGVALCTKAGFGLSMIGAGPYILHLFAVKTLPWFSQGTAEYFWEGFLLIIMCLTVKRFRVRYLLTFACAVVTGFVIDGWLAILGGSGQYTALITRIFAFTFGTVICSFGVSCFFRTTLPLQVYELFVTEFSDKYGKQKEKVKFVFDIILLFVAIAMALLLNHDFKGIGIGTFIITFANAPIIALCGKMLDRLEGRTASGD